MAHEITAQDGLYLATEKAWHGIGNVLPEAVGSMEAMAAANLDWEVQVLPQFFCVPGTPEEDVYESQYSRTVVRMPRKGRVDTDGTPEQFIELSSVGPLWEPIQNRQMFEMIEQVGIGLAGGGLSKIKLESAGSMQQGRRVFALLRGDSFGVGKNGNDEVVKYLLLANGHDAQFSFRAVPTSIRVVCMNTLKMALAGAKGAFTFRHVGDTQKRLDEMALALNRFNETGALFEDKIKALAVREADTKKLKKFWGEAWKIVHGDELPKDEESIQEMKTEIETWTSIMEVEKLELGAQDVTMWLAACAITKNIQHGEPKRKTEKWQENRLVSNVFGDNDEKTTRIMNAALALS